MAENYVLLETIQLTQTVSSVVFDNIPQTGYTDLKIVISALGGSTEGMYIRFNGSTTGFAGRYLIGDGTTPVSGVLDRYIGSIMNQTVTPNNVDVYIPNYTSSNSKSFSVDSSQENAATLGYGNIIAGLWSNSAAISSITLEAANSFRANSSFSLYGVAALNTTPAIAPKATGGNIVANDGTYWYHAFLTSGTFIPQTAVTADILVIAGGGAGSYGSYAGAGGGAGGYLEFTNQALTATLYSCTVGAGGATAGAVFRGNNGNNSTFGSLTSAVGGGGGGGSATGTGGTANNGRDGGSGGGGATNDTSGGGFTYGGNPTTGQGFAGGGNGGFVSSPYPSGGGGGAGGAGQTAPGSSTSGNGGIGKFTTLSNAMGAATLTGVISSSNYYYAGGGGGANHLTGTSGTGGLGGGGNGGQYNGAAGAAGLTNTGGGGGSGTNNTIPGAGGSGIIIIRYPMAS